MTDRGLPVQACRARQAAGTQCLWVAAGMAGPEALRPPKRRPVEAVSAWKNRKAAKAAWGRTQARLPQQATEPCRSGSRATALSPLGETYLDKGLNYGQRP
ncbi:uncharacterized protein [Macaca nemestrina]|uniref:uncharacterized protein n=1 Tax=Macaca nemestrina TaxID=9545 RepID=UPI0039B825A6